MALHPRLWNLQRGISFPRRQKTCGAAIPSSRKLKILSFEVASLMSKLLQILHHLSDSQLVLLRHDLLSLSSGATVFSGDGNFLLSLARAELADSIRLAGDSISLLAGKCSSPSLRRFKSSFTDFADSGLDPHRWIMNSRERKATSKKLYRYLSRTAVIYEQMEKLRELEQTLKKLLEEENGDETTISKLRRNLSIKKQEIQRLKKISLWSFTFDEATIRLAQLSFTALFRLKKTFAEEGEEEEGDVGLFLSLETPSLSFSCINCFSSAVHPSSPERTQKQKLPSFFSASSSLLRPGPSTLGSASLTLRYAAIIVYSEKFFRHPHLIRDGERDELYSMLPESLRKMMREKLREQGRFNFSGEWRASLLRILGLLSPLARNTLRREDERSFRQWHRYSALGESHSPLLPQTLFFADREKIEKNLIELLVGLTLMWRFAMEMRRSSIKSHS